MVMKDRKVNVMYVYLHGNVNLVYWDYSVILFVGLVQNYKL